MLADMKKMAKIKALKALVAHMHKKRFPGDEDNDSPDEAIREEIGMEDEGMKSDRPGLGMEKEADWGESVNEDAKDADDEEGSFLSEKKSFMGGRPISKKKPVSKISVMISTPRRGKK